MSANPSISGQVPSRHYHPTIVRIVLKRETMNMLEPSDITHYTLDCITHYTLDSIRITYTQNYILRTAHLHISAIHNYILVFFLVIVLYLSINHFFMAPPSPMKCPSGGLLLPSPIFLQPIKCLHLTSHGVVILHLPSLSLIHI